MELFTKLSRDDRAVSPVIGVVLMIAVVVILAAVVGAFATGIFGGQSDAPQAAFSYDADANTLTMESGDSVPASELTVNVAGADAGGSWSSDPVEAGTQYTGVGASSGDEIRVIWNDPGSDNSATIFSTTA